MQHVGVFFLSRINDSPNSECVDFLVLKTKRRKKRGPIATTWRVVFVVKIFGDRFFFSGVCAIFGGSNDKRYTKSERAFERRSFGLIGRG